MTPRAPTLEATIPHRPHPFLPTHRARPLSWDVRLWLPKPLSSTPHPHRTAKSTVMANPKITNSVMHPNQFPIESNHHIEPSHPVIKNFPNHRTLRYPVRSGAPIQPLHKNRNSFFDAKALVHDDTLRRLKA